MKIDVLSHTQLCMMKMYADNDGTEIAVKRGEYRFLLSEYTYMCHALAEAKKDIADYKKTLYEVMKKWTEYGYPDSSQIQMFDELKMEFETEGSLEE